MSGVIDTNILLYAANADSAEHVAARRFLRDAGTGSASWYLTEGILYEFLRVSTHARVFTSPLTAAEALQFLDPFVAHPNMRVLTAGSRHWSVLRDLVAQIAHPSGNLFFDIRTVALMREHGIRQIFTADTDFLQFADIEVVNPIARR